ncbi:MAG TPA: N-acetylmuramoyl-L-alanine amidase [Elusimicrobiota bacterium]|nr:N-acetylmuramoyl-L-alanine amidase [Elusimicrobiota bacterium]
MKRWLWLPTLALLGFSACGGLLDGGKETPSRAAPPAASLLAQRPAGLGGLSRESDALLDQRAQVAAAAYAPTDEAATGAFDRLFDGRAQERAGCAPAPGAVYAGGGGTRRPRLDYANPDLVRRPSDLAEAEPPPPDAAQFPPSSAALASGAGKVLAAFDGFERRMYAAAAPVMSRAGWRAARRKGSPVPMTPTHVTVHHTEGAQTMTEAATAAEVRGIQRYHMAGRAREGKDVWDDIGYHFLIDGAGRVVEGRPAETLGAHAGGANENNIGIAMMGNFMKQKPTAEQVESLTRLVSFLAVKYRQDPSRPGFLEGHRHYNNTDCPGTNMMAILAALRLRIDEQTLQLQARILASPKGAFVPVLTSA